MDFLRNLLHNLTSVEALIRWGGYAGLTAIIFSETGLLVGFFLPGDSLLVTAGVFAARGDFNVAIIIPLLATAAIIGQSVGYYIGYKTGPKLFAREDSLLFKKHHLRTAHEFYEKHGASTIIIARFIPIVRTFVPVVAGAAEMNYRKFQLFNIIGGFGWIVSMVLIGYLLGSVIPGIDKHIDVVIIGVIVVSMVPGVVKYLRMRSQKSKA
ncbi:MAG TPA: VTT domain-containing protein [Bacteroidota bacterium]|nr:VTT domain-containing protein [Bacteroidota bacterium]